MPISDDNAPQRGGGPKTLRGKSIARWNALKHGATAKKLFFPDGPHRPEYERYWQLCEELQEELASGAYLEDKILAQKFICDTMVLERCVELQMRLIPAGDDEPVACEAAPNSFRYITHAQRSFFKSLKLIRELRGRVETEAAEIEATAGLDDQTSAPQHEGSNGESDAADQQNESPASAPSDEGGPK